jgi:hypothetical protein
MAVAVVVEDILVSISLVVVVVGLWLKTQNVNSPAISSAVPSFPAASFFSLLCRQLTLSPSQSYSLVFLNTTKQLGDLGAILRVMQNTQKKYVAARRNITQKQTVQDQERVRLVTR